MLFASLFSWWYGAGWLRQVALIKLQFKKALDYFSINELLLTLFAPFRQISAGGVRGPLGVKMRAWFDRLISRFVGAGVRLIIILIGCVYLLLLGILSLAWLVIWAIIPPLPIWAVYLWLGRVA